MKYQSFDLESYNLHIIKTNRFKNCSLEIMFRNKISKENITSKALLADLLCYSSKQYPSNREKNLFLEELYDSNFYGLNTRVGNMIITSFCFEFLNPKYINDLTLEDFLSFPFEMLQNPNIENGEFNIKSFEVIKNSLESEIISLKDNASKYAILETFKKAFPDSAISIQMSGYLEDLNIMSNVNIVKEYEKMIDEEHCDIFLIGDVDIKESKKIVEKIFKLRSIKTNKLPLKLDLTFRKKPLVISSKESYSQSNLVVLYNLFKMNIFEEVGVLQVFNAIFGSNGLDSKLTKYLRQENNLCYSVASYPARYDNVLFVMANIDQKDYSKALKLIDKSFLEIKKGLISDDELNNAKKIVINSLKSLLDNQSAIVNSYFFKYLDNTPLYEDRIKIINDVTKEDVILFSKKIKLNTVNLVKGVEDERN